jgi:hypothetical protein
LIASYVSRSILRRRPRHLLVNPEGEHILDLIVISLILVLEDAKKRDAGVDTGGGGD